MDKELKTEIDLIRIMWHKHKIYSHVHKISIYSIWHLAPLSKATLPYQNIYQYYILQY